MRALLYVSKRTFRNKLKKALHKPTSLLLIIFCILYAIFIAFTLGMVVKDLRFSSAKGLVTVISVWTLYMFLGNFVSYAGKKGVIFRPYHAHFIFVAPISPKLVLVHGAWLNYLLSFAVNILLMIAGVTVFSVAFWKMLLFFLVGSGLEVVFEASLMVWLYTNERIPQKVMTWFCRFIKLLLVAVTAVIVLYFKKYGFSLTTAATFVDAPVLQMLPVVGWNIAVYRLILLGPTGLNLILSALYLLTVAGMFLLALRMKCEGGYYEDAAKFADDYAEARRKSKNGEVVIGIGQKKRKFRKVSVKADATGAKAIFQRQLLEYRKEKGFLFTKTTALCLLLAVIFSFSMRRGAGRMGAPQFFLLGTVAYMTLCMSGSLGKWETELKNPYLFLIPDSPARKLWYATLMEHFRSLVDSSVFCIPLGVVWHVNPVYVIFCILIYTVLSANRLYTKVVAQCILGDSLGKTGQDIIRMLMQMALLGIGIAAALGIGFAINMNLIFPITLVYSIIVTVMLGALASIRFRSMEQLE